ncbi:MAG: hypothetical protein WC413_01620 [Candidatus Nanoarchaeia archaeon]
MKIKLIIGLLIISIFLISGCNQENINPAPLNWQELLDNCQKNLDECKMLGIPKITEFTINTEDLIGKKIDFDICKIEWVKQNPDLPLPSQCSIQVWGNQFQKNPDKLINLKVFCDCWYKE